MSSTAAQEDLTGDWEVEADDEDDCSSVASNDGVATRDDEGDISGAGDTPTTSPFDRRTLGEDYIASLRNNSSLHVTIADQVAKAYEKKAEYGVFSLFFTAVFKDRLRKWTSDVLVEEGHAKITESEFNAYLGLENAMSICPLNEIAEFWSERRFLGQQAFIETMSRNRFQQIRGALALHRPQLPSFDKERDPLWRCRGIMEHFQQRFAEFAVPTGVSSIDEMTVRTKARTRAKTYIPSKPDKYGVRFYAVVGWSSLYVHSLWDNSSGNSMPSTPAERYTNLFPTLRTPLYNTLRAEDVAIEPDTATVMWIAMAGHQTRALRSPTGHRLVVSDNFYTRHTFAQALLNFTDGEMHLLGTVRINLVDKWNKVAVSAAVARVGAGERGTWELVAAVDPEPEWEAKKKAHQNAQRRLAKAKRTQYEPAIVQAERAGYIVYMDRKVVIFYTNDLKATPSVLTLPSSSHEAVFCCHGTYPIQRWTEDRMLHRKVFMAPTVIAAYNLCMNAVDRVDQLRSTNPIRRREKRLGMTMFTWLMDLAIINAQTLLSTVKPDAAKGVSLREFKRRLADVLTSGEKQNKRRREMQQKQRATETLEEIVGMDASLHMITPNSTEHSNGKLLCHLCSVRNIKKKSRNGCTKCEVGFHVECFTAFHNKGALKNSPQLRSALEALCRPPPTTLSPLRARKATGRSHQLGNSNCQSHKHNIRRSYLRRVWPILHQLLGHAARYGSTQVAAFLIEINATQRLPQRAIAVLAPQQLALHSSGRQPQLFRVVLPLAGRGTTPAAEVVAYGFHGTYVMARAVVSCTRL